MNKQAGNMYPWVDYIWNPIRGKCPHECHYCYMRGFRVGELRLEEKELETKLGTGKTIFVGSSVDMFADKVPDEWILRVLKHCREYPENTYLFQSKNPHRFIYLDFPLRHFPEKSILGTTIETNREYLIRPLTNAPNVGKRARAMDILATDGYDTMISIEPIIDFDIGTMLDWIRTAAPLFISIGADSKGHKLPEPSPSKLSIFINDLKEMTDVRLKDNLKRLLRGR